jgi:mycothiol synthase
MDTLKDGGNTRSGDLGRLELLVHPEFRGRRWGSQLLAHGLLWLQEHGCQRAQLWSYGDRRRTVDWLTRLGFASVRVLFQLQRDVSSVEAPVWDEGWSVRPFLDDSQAWHALHLRLQSDPAQAWSLEALRKQLRDPATPPSDFWLLWDRDVLRGYVWLKGNEIFLFALAPEVRGRNLGSKLLAWALAQGDGRASVYCDDQRPAALKLYQNFGFQEVARDRCLQATLSPT